VVKSFGARRFDPIGFRGPREKRGKAILRYVAQQAIESPLIYFFAAINIVAHGSVCPDADKRRPDDAGEFSASSSR